MISPGSMTIMHINWNVEGAPGVVQCVCSAWISPSLRRIRQMAELSGVMELPPFDLTLTY